MDGPLTQNRGQEQIMSQTLLFWTLRVVKNVHAIHLTQAAIMDGGRSMAIMAEKTLTYHNTMVVPATPVV